MLHGLLELILIEQFGFTWWLWVLAISGVISYQLGYEYEQNKYDSLRITPRDVDYFIPGLLIFLFVGIWSYSGYSVEYFKEHYMIILTCLISYPIIGIIWTFIYWRIYFVPNYVKTIYEPIKIKWLKDRNASNTDNKVPEPLTAEFKKYLITETLLWKNEVVNGALVKNVCITPQANKHVSRICATGLWWPISILNYLFMRFLHDAVIGIFNAMRGKLDQISLSYSGKYKQDFGDQ